MAGFSKKIRKHFSKYSLKKSDAFSTRSGPAKGPKPKPSFGSSLRTAFTGRSAPPNTPTGSIYEDSDESDSLPPAPSSTTPAAAVYCEPYLCSIPPRPTHIFSREHTPDSTQPTSDLDSRVAPPGSLPRKESQTVPTAPTPGPIRSNTAPAAYSTTGWNPPSALKSSIRTGTNTTPAAASTNRQGLRNASTEALNDERQTYGRERVVSRPQEDFTYERGLDLEEPVKKEKAKSEKSKKEESPGFMKKASLFWTALKTKYKVHKAESKALEKKSAAQSKLDKASTTTQQPNSNAKVPAVYPLHYNRFVRRTGSTQHLKPETPLHQSKQPMSDPIIHSPKPMKSMPSLAEPSDALARTDLSRNDHITPASHLHRMKGNCVRHGRKRKPEPPAARSMLMKDRNGTYVPTGLPSRRQMEATSPWVVASDSRRTRGTANRDDGSEACPDCVAELRIKRHELQYGSIETVKRPTEEDQTEETKHIDYEPPVSLLRTVQTEDGHASYTSEDEDLVTLKDLGLKLNAIIVEHEGDLRRVVLNSRSGQPTICILQKLSKDLAKVSNSIAFAGIGHASNEATSTTELGRAAIVLDTSHAAFRESMRTSVPDLLDMIDQAANDIHLNTGKLAEHYTCRRGVPGANNHSIISTDEFDNLMNGPTSPTYGIVGRQNMHEQYRSMHEHLKNAARKESIRSIAITTPKDAQSLHEINANHLEIARLSPEPNTGDNSDFKLPTIVQTRPTTQPITPRASSITPAASTQVETASKINAPQLSTHPTSDMPSSATPSGLEPTRNHSPFLSWLNPFHHHKPETPLAATSKPSQPSSPLSTTPTPGSSIFSGVSNVTKPELTDLSTLNSPMLDIAKHPNPYHHAPSVPSRMDVGKWAEDKVREHQQVIKAAMQMEQNMTARKASAVERELRRQRSALTGDRKGQMRGL